MYSFSGNTNGNIPIPSSPYGFEIFSRRNDTPSSFTWHGKNSNNGASFKFEWEDADQFLGRVGLFLDEGHPHSFYGDIFCDFNHVKGALSEPVLESIEVSPYYSYIGVYGWTRDPLIEWNIVEDWFGDIRLEEARLGVTTWRVGSFFLDGSDYVVFQAIRPAKVGNIDNARRPFLQYFSVRQTPRQSGTVSVSEHFKQWEQMGMPLGSNLYEVKFFVESAFGDGSIDVSHVQVRLEK